MFTDLYKLQGFHSPSVAIDLFCGACTTQTRNQYKRGSVALWHVLVWAIPGNQIYVHKIVVLWYSEKDRGLHIPLKWSLTFQPTTRGVCSKSSYSTGMNWKLESPKALSSTRATGGFAYPSPLPGSQGLGSVRQSKVWVIFPLNRLLTEQVIFENWSYNSQLCH